MFNERESKKVWYEIYKREIAIDICPNCKEWMSDTQTYYDDGSIATITSGGSGVVIMKQGKLWVE
jgi:hypothetical protein